MDSNRPPTSPGLGIIWDFDGTLFDTQQKNLSVTRAIVSQILGKSPEEFPSLETVEEYVRAQRGAGNWWDFYKQHLGLDEEGTDWAGSHWVDFQLHDQTEVLPISGVVEVIDQLGGLPQGIVSQNARPVIAQILETHRWSPYFDSIIGHAKVPMRRQKPEPDGIFLCLQELSAHSSGTILFIGDHETDTLTVHNANARAQQEGLELRFVSVVTAYHEEVEPSSWAEQPDFVVEQPSEVLEVIDELCSIDTPFANRLWTAQLDREILFNSGSRHGGAFGWALPGVTMFKTVLAMFTGLLLTAGSTQADPLRYQIEANHSTIGFSIPIFGGLSRVSGKFTDVDIEVILDEDDLEASSVTVVLQVSGIDTGIEMRDKDLQSKIFFDAKKYPEIRFVSKKIRKNSEGKYEALVSFTMKGITREISFVFELKIHRFDNGIQILGVRIRTELNRIDFGVGAGWQHSAMENFLGDLITLEIDLWTSSGKPVE